jgi:5-methylcytosine-specific restriction endonuclease McrA
MSAESIELDGARAYARWLNLHVMIDVPLFPLKAALFEHIAFREPDDYGPFPACLLHEHPLTCFEAPVPKFHRTPDHPRRGRVPPLMAFQAIYAAIFTKVEILDEDGRMPCPVTLHLVGPTSFVPDMAAVLNWRPRDTRPFIEGLTECGILQPELAAAIIAKIGTRTKREKRVPPSKALKAAIMAKTSGRCAYCGVPLTTQRDKPNSFHADHVFPVKKGAANDPALLVPACAKCNIKKGAKTFMEFARDSQ